MIINRWGEDSKPEERIVTALPLHELWNNMGVVAAEECGALSSDDIRNLLRVGLVCFVVAHVGRPLVWVPLEQCYTFWKEEVKERVVDPLIAERGYFLDDYPGASCYLAAAWRSGTGEPIVLLSTSH